MHILNNPISRTTLFFGDFVADTILRTPTPNPSFVENIQYAQETMDYTIKTLCLGATNKSNSKASFSKMKEMRNAVIKKMDIWQQNSPENSQKWQEVLLTAQDTCAKQYKMGNCGEHSAVSFCYLKNTKQITSIDKLDMVFSDHVFVLIGRKHDSSADDVTTWGESCVVCDAWAERIYPLSEIDYHLKDICRIYNLTIENDNLSLKVTINGHKLIRDTSTPCPPSLNPEKQLIIQDKIRDYQSFKHRSFVHQKAGTITALAIGLIGSLLISSKLLVKLSDRSWNLLRGSSITIATILCYSSFFFEKHAQMYEKKANLVWK